MQGADFLEDGEAELDQVPAGPEREAPGEERLVEHGLLERYTPGGRHQIAAEPALFVAGDLFRPADARDADGVCDHQFELAQPGGGEAVGKVDLARPAVCCLEDAALAAFGQVTVQPDPPGPTAIDEIPRLRELRDLQRRAVVGVWNVADPELEHLRPEGPLGEISAVVQAERADDLLGGDRSQTVQRDDVLGEAPVLGDDGQVVFPSERGEDLQKKAVGEFVVAVQASQIDALFANKVLDQRESAAGAGGLLRDTVRLKPLDLLDDSSEEEELGAAGLERRRKQPLEEAPGARVHQGARVREQLVIRCQPGEFDGDGEGPRLRIGWSLTAGVGFGGLRLPKSGWRV